MTLPGLVAAPGWRFPKAPTITNVDPDDGATEVVTVNGTADRTADVSLFRVVGETWTQLGTAWNVGPSGTWSIPNITLNPGANDLYAIAFFGAWYMHHQSPWSAKFTAQYIEPGSQSFTSPGTYQFTVPLYNTLTVDVKGGSGGGGAVSGEGYGDGTAGTQSSFNTNVIAYPGTGGTFSASGHGHAGSPGGASGGDQNYTGGGFAGGDGADMPYNPGGASGRAVKAYAAGQLTVNTQITVVVGEKGLGGDGGSGGWNGYPGHDGAVTISWS